MKTINQIAVLITLSVLGFISCTKNFEDINTDKNLATKENFDYSYSLAKAELEYTGNSDFSYETWRVNIIYCSLMMQQLANNSWYSGDKYIANDGWTSSYFQVAYPSQVKYILDIIRNLKDNPLYSNLYNITRIVKVLIFHRITDLYGDIPYFEAGNGLEGSNSFITKYDSQKDIYTDFFKELDEAQKALDKTKDIIKNDLIYQGDIDKWKKFANSLMLRLAMRLTKVDIGTATAMAEKNHFLNPSGS